MCDLLVLDDDPLVRNILVDALREAGLDAVGAGVEAEALGLLRDGQPPKVFVTDLDLGTRRNGFVVAGIARMLFPAVPIIYITGRPDTLQGRVLDPHETVLHKPFRPSELVALVRTLLAQAAPPP